MSQSRSSVYDKLRKRLEEVNSAEAGNDRLRDLVEWLYQEMLEMEFSEHVGAERYERTPDRQGYRNGYRDRQLHTRVGTLNLRVPRDRDGKFSTHAVRLSNWSNAIHFEWLTLFNSLPRCSSVNPRACRSSFCASTKGW
jgi:hypothetical protein